jgi:hypothetical protein
MSFQSGYTVLRRKGHIQYFIRSRKILLDLHCTIFPSATLYPIVQGLVLLYILYTREVPPFV